MTSQTALQPLTINQRANIQTASYVFFALEPNTKYEVRLQAKNLHGWGQFSADFMFRTGSRGALPKELPVETLTNHLSGSYSANITGTSTNSTSFIDLNLSGKELGLVSEGMFVSPPTLSMFVFTLLLLLEI